jgi:5-(carboxyamino)imidazole ribonucleotide mutase
MDSLLSIVQMPSGIPVATMAIDGSRNAALMAVEILALSDQGLEAKLEDFRRKQSEKVLNTTI